MTQVAAQVFDFTLTLAGPGEFTADLADALYEAGCDDATFGTSNGEHFGTFHREAASLGKAIGSAVDAVGRVGFSVTGIRIEGGDGR